MRQKRPDPPFGRVGVRMRVVLRARRERLLPWSFGCAGGSRWFRGAWSFGCAGGAGGTRGSGCARCGQLSPALRARCIELAARGSAFGAFLIRFDCCWSETHDDLPISCRCFPLSKRWRALGERVGTFRIGSTQGPGHRFRSRKAGRCQAQAGAQPHPCTCRIRCMFDTYRILLFNESRRRRSSGGGADI